MITPAKSPLIFYPKTINELISLYSSMPESLIYAGGTGILKDKNIKYPILSENIIFISGINELSTIKRTEGYIEIGACASLGRIIGIGEHVLKPALYKALLSIGTGELRNIATIGGNICNPFFRKNLVPLLCILDTKVELKKQDSTRRLNLRQFISPGEGLENGEVLTKIRIPFNKFNYEEYKVTGYLKSNFNSALTFSALASVQKDVITSLRFTAGYGSSGIFRTRDFEETLTGRKLPIYGITQDPTYLKLKTALKNNNEEIPSFQQQQIEGFFLSFMHSLNDSL